MGVLTAGARVVGICSPAIRAHGMVAETCSGRITGTLFAVTTNSLNRLHRLLLAGGLVSTGCGEPPAVGPAPPPMTGATPFMVPPLQRPPLQAAEAAVLADDQDIIGIVVNGAARAYSTRAMSAMRYHVVNDSIAGTSATVTYCDRTDCVKVFGLKGAADPLSLSIAGWNGEELVLALDGRTYSQTSEEIPLEPLPYQRMTWKEWRELHPETLVFANPGAGAGNATESGRGQ